MGKKPTYEELEARLAKAESYMQAIRNGKVDIIVGSEGALAVQLAETQQALEKRTHELAQHRDRLEELVQKRTAELTRTVEEVEQQRKAMMNVSQDLRRVNKKLVLEMEERRQAEEQLIAKNNELAIFNRLAVNRELKMVELKKEVNHLLEKAGQEPHYVIAR
ncbi:MAG: hypothetical protein GY761_14005 [Hyphomicrobiales bacterium]|nr:hypothetical protein [Hyphomicrobiales bacterium]